MGRLLIIPELERIEESLRLAEEYNCTFEYNDFCRPEVLEDRERQRELISAYRSVRGDFSKDTLHGAFLDVTVHSEDPGIREVSCLRVRQSMELAGELGVKGVVFHTGRLKDFRAAGYLERWEETNRRLFTRLHDEYPGIEIYMENMFDESPDVLAGLAERMKGRERFGVCLDYAHAALTSCAPEEWFTYLAPYIRHIHINDNDLHNDLHLAVGQGKIDWKRYRRLMKDFGLSASVLVEVRRIGEQRRSLEYMKEQGLLLEETREGGGFA